MISGDKMNDTNVYMLNSIVNNNENNSNNNTVGLKCNKR